MRARSSGLSLAETMVSLTVLTLVMVAVLNLFPSSLAIVRTTRTSWLARAAAQDRIEAIASEPFATITIGFEQQDQVQLSDGATCLLRTTVSAVDGHSTQHLKRIRCEAEWKGKASTKRASQEVYVHSVRR